MKIIFCVGCSTTGAGQPITYKPRDGGFRFYSTFLQEMMGDDYDVRQFGQGGVSMSKSVRTSIWNHEDSGKKSKVFADLIRIANNQGEAFDRCFEGKYKYEDCEFIFVNTFGTNDADNRMIEIAHKDFVKSYNDYLKLFPNAKHYVAYLPPTFGGYSGGQHGHDIDRINALVSQVNTDYYLDLRWGWTSDMTYDLVHPSNKGAEHMASIIAKQLEQAQPTPKPNGDIMIPTIKIENDLLSIIQGFVQGEKYSWNVRYLDNSTEFIGFGDGFTITRKRDKVAGNKFWCYPLSDGNKMSNKVIYTENAEAPVIIPDEPTDFDKTKVLNHIRNARAELNKAELELLK